MRYQHEAVKWSYAPDPKWGRKVATCTVTLAGRSERWQATGDMISDAERIDVPKLLTDRIKATIRLFGPVLEDDDG